VTGIGLVVTAAVAVLMAVALLDWLMNLPPAPRTLLDVTALAALGYGVWRWIVHPLLHRLTLNDIAGRVERAYPQFEDRLRSTVNIMLGRDIPGSAVMKQRVVSEATRLSNGLDLTRVVIARPAVYAFTTAAAAVLLLAAVVSLMDPAYTKAAMERLFTPFANVPWPKQVEIGIVGDIPTRVTVGQRIDVGIRLSKGDKPSRKAIIYYSYGDAGGEHFTTAEQQLMTRGDDGIYHASVDARVPADALAGSIKIHIDSGDASTPPVTVKVVQRLSLTRVDAEVTAPPYAHVPVVKLTLGQTPGVMTVGSTVKLTATFNKAIDPAKPVVVEMLGTKLPSPFTWAEPVGNSVTGTLTATDSIRFRLKATDIDGISNPAAEEFELVVKPDQNPTVAIEYPHGNTDYTPEAVVPFQAHAEDDFGIKTLTLVVDRLGDKKHWEIPLVADSKPTADCKWTPVDDGGDLQRFRANYDWTLAGLKDAGLKPGDVLQYYAVVNDNFVLNGQTHAPVSSGWLKITIISQDQFDEARKAELNTLGENIQATKQSQTGTATQTRSLAEELKDKATLDDADKAAVDRLAGQQASAASEADTLARKAGEILSKMDENRATNKDLRTTVNEVRHRLTNAAEHPMKDAGTDISAVPDAKGKDERAQDLSDAGSEQIKANEQLQKAIDAMGGIMGLNTTLDHAQALLAKQLEISKQTGLNDKGTLGKTRDQMTPAEKAAADKNAEEQASLGKEVAALLAQMPKDAAKLEKTDPTGSAAMKSAAATGTSQNIPGRQKEAADATKANEQSKAQGAQTEAALDLKTMVEELKEAQSRKLDELSKKLGELQEQAAALIRQQAGHNLNDIALQTPDQRAKIKKSVIDDLTLYAEREKNPQTTEVSLPMLTSAQEQTEHNTRDIAQTAEAMPDGGEPADRLTRAADKMERAIVNLRQTKIADAYSPAQVDALQSLIEAKKVIDEQKKKADEKKQGQKKEQIKAKYIAILLKQKDINSDTRLIDGKPRNDDGSLKRPDSIALNAVGGHQNDNADAVKALNTDLEEIDSTVYSYVNQQIMQNMLDVRDSLSKKQTGAVVQAQQEEILSMLDKMIRDLSTDPEKLPYTQKGGDKDGGGGGGKNKGLPTEAELRLLRDLQTIVNDSTTKIATLATPDKPRLAKLGEQQESLRNLLDKLIQKASQGKSSLPPEGKNQELLPEEGTSTKPERAAEKVDNGELDDDLLGTRNRPAEIKIIPTPDKDPATPPKPAPPTPPTPAPGGDHELDVLGDRMARSHQRLANNYDAGAVTQEIQKRILTDLDDLIEQARKKEAQGQNQPPKPGDPDDGQKMGGKPNKGQPQKTPAEVKAEAELKAAQAAACGSAPGKGGGAAKPPEGSPELAREEQQQWGRVTAREREAVTESKGEKVLDKYKNLVDDYYRTMSAKSQGQ
jgi:hypothetical protein